jgi:hypothetical protein
MKNFFLLLLTVFMHAPIFSMIQEGKEEQVEILQEYNRQEDKVVIEEIIQLLRIMRIAFPEFDEVD